MPRIETDFTDVGLSVVLDFETTGLDPKVDRIVSIAAIRADFSNVSLSVDGKLKLTTTTFHEVLNPQTPIPRAASKVHGIFDADVQGKKTFSEIATELATFIGTCPMISHNMKFDTGFLDAEMKRANVKSLAKNRRLCTMMAVHKRAVEIEGRSAKWPRLADSGRFVGMTINQSSVHSATEDAMNALLLVVGLKTTYFDQAAAKIYRYR